MAKISQLPALNDPNGTELVPVVKDGKTLRASVAGLVAGAVAGTVDNLKVDAVAYIGRPGDAVLVDGTPTGIGAVYWHDAIDDAGSVIAVDVFDRAAGTINLASYRGPLGALARTALSSFKTTGTRTSRRIMLAEPIPVRAGDILAVQPTAGALVVAEVQSGDVGYTYSAPYLPETIALDAPTTNGQVQVRFVIAYRKQVVTADTFLASTAVKIVGPRAVATSSDVNPRGYVEWKTLGQPTAHTVRWGNYTVNLDGKTQRMEFPNFSLAQPYAFIGNSLTDSTDVLDRWSQLLAAQYLQLMISAARYSSDWRMVYRVGAKAIVLTLAGTLPAAGTVAVSKINGAAIDGNNPAAFLTTGDPGVVTGMAMSGYLTRNGVTRRATVSAPNGASFAYVVTQAPGQTAITFDGPVTFVPDFALQVPGRICVIWLGNNYFYSQVPNGYGDYTNPQMWVDLKLIVAFLQARGCRVLLIPIIPSANTAEGDNWLARGAGTPYTAMESANARTDAMFPGLMARHADGRTLLKFLQDRNDGSPEALDDVAKGFTPRNLRRRSDGSYDLLHMYGDGAGDRAVKDFVDSALRSQALPNAVTQTTDFVITAIGAGEQQPDVAVTRVGRDGLADLADRVGVVAAEAATDPSYKRYMVAMVLTGFGLKGMTTGEVNLNGGVVQASFADGSRLTGNPDADCKRRLTATMLSGFLPAGYGSPTVDATMRIYQALRPDGSAAVGNGDITGKLGMTALVFSAFTPQTGRVNQSGGVLPGGVDRDAGWISVGRQAPASGIAILTGATPNRLLQAFLDDGRTITISKPGDDPDVFLQSGDSIKYRRTTPAITGGGATMVSELIAPEVVPSGTTAMQLVLMFGQSNGAGYSDGSPAIVTKSSVSPRALMFSGGPRLGLRNLADKLELLPLASLGPLREKLDTYAGETPLSGLASTYLQALPANVSIIGNTVAIGGARIEELRKGTQPYANALRLVQRSKVVADRLGLPFKVLRIVWIQGEANIGPLGATGYKTELNQLQTDFDTDIRAMLGQAETVQFVCAQISSWFNNTANARSSTPLACLELALQYPTRFACSGPMYRFQFTPASTLHLMPAGTNNHGAMIGHVLGRLDAGVLQPYLAAKSATLSGNTVTLDYSLADGALVLDTSVVTNPGNYGFEFGQTGGNAVTVTNVAITGTNVVLTLSAEPTGTARWIGVALTGAVGALPGPTTGARACLRDTSTQQGPDGSYLHNYAGHQQLFF
ncbi:hypothetical protein ASE82_11680 [Sphingomonas sp. Leaf230]|uniref:sialate O-acetylesterase n=1 Tax=Sphingomonas sp. Leaf230 TaxID=1735694 RepID=UPI0006F81137|nr:sialate O-acetylesterase [Sphingomonas sp. Leaf230]KQN01935.1 hypothetical protein ASE82_11680 [Sphingomonas sp. Leaf230]